MIGYKEEKKLHSTTSIRRFEKQSDFNFLFRQIL